MNKSLGLILLTHPVYSSADSTYLFERIIHRHQRVMLLTGPLCDVVVAVHSVSSLCCVEWRTMIALPTEVFFSLKLWSRTATLRWCLLKRRRSCTPSLHKRVGQRDACLRVQTMSSEAPCRPTVLWPLECTVGRSLDSHSCRTIEHRISIASLPVCLSTHQPETRTYRTMGGWRTDWWDWSNYWSDSWFNWVSLCMFVAGTFYCINRIRTLTGVVLKKNIRSSDWKTHVLFTESNYRQVKLITFARRLFLPQLIGQQDYCKSYGWIFHDLKKTGLALREETVDYIIEVILFRVREFVCTFCNIAMVSCSETSEFIIIIIIIFYLWTTVTHNCQ